MKKNSNTILRTRMNTAKHSQSDHLSTNKPFDFRIYEIYILLITQMDLNSNKDNNCLDLENKKIKNILKSIKFKWLSSLLR